VGIVRLEDATWPQLGGWPTVLVPVGSLEQHGPHLPFSTDTTIAVAVSERVAAVLATDNGTDVVIAPAIAYSASGEHQGFAGTVSLGHEALRITLVELVRSMSTWAGRIVLVNGHGGNLPTIVDALRQLLAEQHDVCWVPCAFEMATDAHAGHDETSVMLHIAPERVDMSSAVVGNTADLESLLPDLRRGGVAAVSSTGVLGDPTRATAEQGEALLGELVARTASAISRGERGAGGRLVRVPATVGGVRDDG
jgi:mycofactocin precursor peptide peptidase